MVDSVNLEEDFNIFKSPTCKHRVMLSSTSVPLYMNLPILASYGDRSSSSSFSSFELT